MLSTALIRDSLQSLRVHFLLSFLIVAAFLVPVSGRGQVSFTGASTTVTAGYNQPTGVALDASGNVYFTVFGGNQQLKETLQADGTYAQSILPPPASGYDFSWGTAVDSQANVYITNFYSNSVVQLTPSGGTYTAATLAMDAGVSPTGVAVDAAGNLYVSSTGSQAVFLETPAGAGAYTKSTIVSGLGAGGPYGIAVDALGNVYIADTGDNLVLMETPNGDGTYAQTTIGIGLSSPAGVAVDALGNVYIADSGNNRILKETLSAGVYTQTTVGSGFSNPQGIALDGNGNLYVANDGGGTIVELHVANVPWGAVAIGSSSSLTLNFTVASGATVGSVGIFTTGVSGKDFNDAGSSTCTARTYSSTTRCAVNVSFAPLAAGLRRGAVVLYDDSGNALSSVPVYGVGTGPQVAYGPGINSFVGSGYGFPVATTVDAAGNAYVTDLAAGQVYKVSPDGTKTAVGSGYSVPVAVAVDGEGNVFVGDEGNKVVYRVAPGGTQSQVVDNIALPQGLALDGAGNLYISNYQNPPAVYKVAPGGAKTVIGSGFSGPEGVAVDPLGNVYVIDANYGAGAGALDKIAPDGTQSTVNGALIQPSGIALDSAGNAYISDEGTGSAVVISPSGVLSTIATGFANPSGIAVDGAGNVFVVDAGNANLVKIDRSDPPSIDFAATVVGNTSTGSPSTVHLADIGNRDLEFSALSYPVDFPEGLAAAEACTSSTSLNPGQQCDLPINFSPLSQGLLNETVTVIDNALNVPGAAQSVSVSGTGTKNVASQFSVTGPGEVTAGTPFTIQVTALDASNHTVSSYAAPVRSATGASHSGTIRFSSTDSLASLPANATLSSGAGSFQVTLNTAGIQTVATADTANSSATGSARFQVDPGPATHFAITAPSSAYVGGAVQFSVTAFDALGNVATAYAGILQFASSDPAAVLPPPATLAAGVGTFSATFLTAGSQTITATDSVMPGIAGFSNTVSVSIPNLVVTSAIDSTGTCTPQPAPATGTDASCSLRDALQFAAANGSANITFDSSIFADSTDITLSNGTLSVPPNTTITGPTSGSGPALINLVTVNGNNASTVFTVNSGVASIANLIVANGSQASGQSHSPMIVGTPTVDDNGVKYYPVTSTFQRSQQQIVRVLEPTNPAPGKPRRILYVLPVESGVDTTSSTYSDGLEELRLLDVPNRFNMTLIAPAFNYAPWYGDNILDPATRMESFIIDDLVPFGDTFAQSGVPQRYLIGFSKSGNGSLFLILRHPGIFNAAAAWDSPAQLSDLFTSGYAPLSDFLMNFGTQENFDSYIIPTLVANNAGPFQQQNRLWISGDDAVFTDQMAALNDEMTAASILHTFVGGTVRDHSWNSGWLDGAVSSLDANATLTAPSAGSIAPPRTGGGPWGTLAFGATQATLGLTTDTNATCRYATVPGMAFASMVNTMSTTGGTSHSTLVTGLAAGGSYSYYVRCQDGSSGTVNSDDYAINFSVAANSTSVSGGGIINGGTLTLTNVALTNNSASNFGGAIYNSGTLNVFASTFSGNSATLDGGAIYNAGTASLTRSTFSGDSSAASGGGFANGTGAAATLSQDTFSQNTSGLYGGAIRNYSGTLTVTASTISGNTSTADGGGIHNSGTLNLANTIVAGNAGANFADVDGSYVDNGGNQSGAGPGGTSAIAIGLAPLDNYGGAIQTMLPLPGSPAICAGLAANLGGQTTDQRGLALDGNCHSGAVDAGAVQTSYVLSFSIEPPATALVGQVISPAPVVQITENGSVTAAATGSVSIADSASLLAGTTTESLDSGLAAFDALSIGSAASGDTLTATLPLNPALDLNLTATSTGISALKLTPTITWGALAPIQYGTALSATQLNATANVPGTFVYTPAAGAVLSPGLQLLSVAFTPDDTTRYALASATNSITVDQQASLTAPAAGSRLPGASVTFSWTTGGGVTQYELWLGSTGVGSSNIFNSGAIGGTSVNFTAVPTNGVLLYARLWSMINGKWQSADYTFTEAGSPTKAMLASPAPGSLLAGANVTFSWTAGAGPTQYELCLSGIAAGQCEAFNSGPISATSVNVPNVPVNGVLLYARIYSRINGAWQPFDCTYTEAGSPTLAALKSPAPGSVLAGSSATFSWSAGAGPTAYVLWLGTTGIGSANILNSGTLGASTTSVTVNNLPVHGVKLYARMWSMISGTWRSVDFTYTEAGTPALAALTSPAPGGVLAGSSATFAWNPGSGPTAYELWLGTTGVGSANIINSGTLGTSTTSVRVNNIPTNGVKVYARMWSQINGAWQSIDYTYTESGTAVPATLKSPAAGSQLLGSNATFSWTAGAGPTQYELWLGTTGMGSNDLFNSGPTTNTSVNVTGLPMKGVLIYVRLYSMLSGIWQPIDYTITEAGTVSKAALTSPAPGTQLPGANVTFSWTAGRGPVAYQLWLGTTGIGSSNLYNSGSVTATSVDAAGLPRGAVTIYARLWSRINNAWQSNDYEFTSAP